MLRLSIHAILLLLVVFSILSVWVSTIILFQRSDSGETDRLVPSSSEFALSTANYTRSIGPSSGTFHEPIKIAHVISLISCQKQVRVKGFLDALVILRHSIHKNSVHSTFALNNQSTSRYSYQMYAMVHPDGGCLEHVDLLHRLGYIPVILPTPVNISRIPIDSFYRKMVEKENCCGSKEFIKLYAYTLTQHPIFVHWDLDVAVLKPLDDLFDAMLFDRNSRRGRAARQRIHIQRPGQRFLPDRIDAFFTRDVTSSQPWEKVQGVQGGFLVARPNKEHFRLYQELIAGANYTRGRGPNSGWGGMGYGGFQGAMAYQGVVAFFYDQIYPGRAVELDVCRWNNVVADVIWRGPSGMEYFGQCRQFPWNGADFRSNTPSHKQCEDCRNLSPEETNTVHFTACKKPWQCILPIYHPPGQNRRQHEYRLKELTNVTTCLGFFKKYFELRKEVERLLAAGIEEPFAEPRGTFYPNYFLGYCEYAGGYFELRWPDNINMTQIYKMSSDKEMQNIP